MSDLLIGVLAILGLFVLVMGGVPIAFALIAVSLGAMFLLTDSVDLTALLASNAALGGVRNYIFVVVPLFVLMGAFMSNSTAARYLYAVAQLAMRRLIGGLATATVFANTMFSAVTGVSVASAAIFARISVPEMLRHGYGLRLALGAVAGSSVLGMLIPPSLLMILYGVLAQVSIGSLFIAGILPGLVLAVLYGVTIALLGWWHPEVVGRESVGRRRAPTSELAADALEPAPVGAGAGTDTVPVQDRRASRRSGRAAAAQDSIARITADGPAEWDRKPVQLLAGTIPIAVLIIGVIGGIWLGWFTPTEAAAVGAFGALLIAGLYSMRREGLVNSFRETAISTGAIMLLLIAAQMYSRVLARSGLISDMTGWINDAGLPPLMLIVVFIGILILLGAILDSSSILLIMVPLMVPAIQLMGEDPIWFGVVMIIAIEVGLLTPPFGMVAFSMSAVLGDRVRVEDIFVGSIPFIAAMLLTLALVIGFPGLATWLPGLL